MNITEITAREKRCFIVHKLAHVMNITEITAREKRHVLLLSKFFEPKIIPYHSIIHSVFSTLLKVVVPHAKKSGR
jgi:hypothetical protein